VKRRRGRTHLVRCSAAADLYNAADGCHDRKARWREKFERMAIRRADKAYAPSAFVAEHYRRQHHITVKVLRPPLGMELMPSTVLPCGLPDRFFIHFGQLSCRKGTLWLVKALRQAFAMEPSLRLVLVGQGSFKEIGAWLATLGPDRAKVQVLYPLPKAELYSVLKRADAAVLPSLVDNLPNTVIESLMLGIPEIGARGGSIDELVYEGVNGELVAPSDVAALAETMVRAWRGESSARKGFVWNASIAQEMQPTRAIANLLRLARQDDQPLSTIAPLAMAAATAAAGPSV
jgi:glycosyltransferase involved in cell wall biosynthesis